MRNNNLPPLEWLRAFEAAGRLSGFTAAGKEIGLTQAAVSQRITALEGRLQTSLFKRKHKGVELTAEGDAYLPIVASALSELRRGTVDLFAHHRQHIRLVATASVANLWIVPRLANISRKHPNLDISIASIHRDVDYDSAKYDWQFRLGDGNWPGQTATRIYRETLAPVCTQMLLETAADGDWRKLPRISLKGPRLGWNRWATANNIKLAGTASLNFDSFITALNAARADAGVLLASLPLCQSMIDAGQLVQLEKTGPETQSGLWMTKSSDQPATTIAGALVESMTQPVGL